MTLSLKKRFDEYTIGRYGRVQNPPTMRFVTLIFDIVDMDPATVREAIEEVRQNSLRKIRRSFPQIWMQGAFDFECINPDEIVRGPHTCINNKNLIRSLSQGEIFNGHHRVCLHAHILVDLVNVDPDDFSRRCKAILNVHPLQVNVKRLHKNKSLEINLKRLSEYMFKRPIHYKFNYTEVIRRKGNRMDNELIGRMALLYSSLGGMGYSNLLISTYECELSEHKDYNINVNLNDTTDISHPYFNKDRIKTGTMSVV